MSDDYYTALGVSKGADLKKIKKAYREVIKRYHPDATGSTENVERFLEIREAYETLGDEAKRKRYDLELGKEPSHGENERTAGIIHHRRSLFDEMETHFSSTDEFFEGLIPGFFHSERGKTRGKDLYFEAVLSSEEARRGGLFPITVPVTEPCPRCMKTGYVDAFFCPVCSGVGRVTSERTFSLNIPPNVQHGTELSVSMEDIGLRDAVLYIRALIDPFM
jgi:molecular chaperone DnaJ